MNLVRSLALILCALLVVSTAQARDTKNMFSYKDAVTSPEGKAKLGNFKFLFGKNKGNVEQDLGELRTNKKTNAFNKSDYEACQWAFLSAMIALRDSAVKKGADAVVEIRSNYKNNLLTDNDEQFECGAGALMAGVALVGRAVKLKK